MATGAQSRPKGDSETLYGSAVAAFSPYKLTVEPVRRHPGTALRPHAEAEDSYSRRLADLAKMPFGREADEDEQFRRAQLLGSHEPTAAPQHNAESAHLQAENRRREREALQAEAEDRCRQHLQERYACAAHELVGQPVQDQEHVEGRARRRQERAEERARRRQMAADAAAIGPPGGAGVSEASEAALPKWTAGAQAEHDLRRRRLVEADIAEAEARQLAAAMDARDTGAYRRADPLGSPGGRGGAPVARRQTENWVEFDTADATARGRGERRGHEGNATEGADGGEDLALMSVMELRDELLARGVVTRGLFEKHEFVDALRLARVADVTEGDAQPLAGVKGGGGFGGRRGHLVTLQQGPRGCGKRRS